MDTGIDIQKFSEDFRQEVINDAELEGEEGFREDVFTQLMIDYLCEAGEIDEGMVCSHRSHGMQVNGYGISEDEECLYIMVSIHKLEALPPKIGKNEIEPALKKAKNFIQKSFNGLHLSMEEASPIFDLALQIYDLKKTMTRIRIYLLTDGIAKMTNTEESEIAGIPVSFHIWDLERLFRWRSSGKERETLLIDFEKEFGGIIPCLPMPTINDHYVAYLALFPAEILFKLYQEYGSRLLERNVRSFLQVRGNVNKGIRNTILNEPHMFLAYNNGISATSEAVELVSLKDGKGIKSVIDFQIVNGGQTTASIYNAVKKDKADISNIFVQVKLTVLMRTEKMDEIVPLISKYANNQNKIQTADFSANDPFHRKMEELSRTIWAPAVSGIQRQTRWFYERARGQYMDQKNRERTRAGKKAFESAHPNSQKFTKTDLAKFENTWDQLPYLVSRGSQKNFQEFTLRIKQSNASPNQQYFEQLIAKAILFKRADKLIQTQKYGGYKANVVTYTLSFLSHCSAKRINLNRIWKEQSLSPALDDAIIRVSNLAHRHIVNPPGGGNVTEWCKKENCWKEFKNCTFALTPELEQELISYGKVQTEPNESIDSPNEKEKEIIFTVAEYSADTWFALSSWSKETSNLSAWQRKLAFSLGRLAAQGRLPSKKQAAQGMIIIDESKRLGFKDI